MKVKLLSLIVILFIQNSFSQKISPFPDEPALKSPYNEYQTQITYFDFNFVSMNFQNYMIKKTNMTLDDTKYNLKSGVGTITDIYINNGINTKIKKLYFTYTVFTIENDFVIKKLRISGDTDVVLKFYIFYWSTNLNYDDVKGRETVSNRFLQDRISYNFNEGKSFIEINNTSIKNTEEFIKRLTKVLKEKKEAEKIKDSLDLISEIKKEKEKVEMDKELEIQRQITLVKKAENDKKINIAYQKRQAQLKKEQEDFDKSLNTKKEIFTYQVVKKKKKLTLELMFANKVDSFVSKIDLEKKISEILLDKILVFTLSK